MEMEFFDALKQVEKATLNKRDDCLYLRWITGGYDKEISFSDFKASLIEKVESKTDKNPEEILQWLFEEVG